MRRAVLACSLWAAIASACATPKTAIGRVEADAILVLGHKPPLHRGELEAELRARVDHGIALYEQGRAPLLVMSGGESTPGVIEADEMARHAMRAGVPSEALVSEPSSRDTIENARFSVAMLRARITDRAPRVLLVTSDYHIGRAARLVRCAGADVEIAPVALSLSPRERAAKERSERWVRFYYAFIEECRRARR